VIRVKKRVKKSKSTVKSKVKQIAKFFVDNPDRVISKQELASKFTGSDDFVACSLITSGYIPLVYKELEANYEVSLRNFRKKGWQLTTGGIDAFLASDPFERKWKGYKNSLRDKINLYDLSKWPEHLRALAENAKMQMELAEQQMKAISQLRNSIREGIACLPKPSGNGDKNK